MTTTNIDQTLDAVQEGDEKVITDPWARGVKESLSGDLTAMYIEPSSAVGRRIVALEEVNRLDLQHHSPNR